MADTYAKTLKLETVVEKKQYEQFVDDFKKNSIAMKLMNEKEQKSLAKGYADTQMRLKKIEKLKQSIADIKMYGGKESKDALKKLEKELKETEKLSLSSRLKKQFSKDGVVGSQILNVFSEGGKIVSKFISDTFNNAIEELKTMSSYNYGTTLFQNQDSLNSALQYGLSGNQAYGLDKALSFFGASSIEDTYYWNDKQRDKFAEKIGYYTDKFNSLNDSGFFEKWDEFRYEFKTFKDDMMYDIMQFIMDNKDTILKGFTLLTDLMKMIVSLVGGIADLLNVQRTDAQRTSATSDIISNYSTSNSKSLTVNNTFNGVQTSNKTELINAGNLTYTQVKEALYSY